MLRVDSHVHFWDRSIVAVDWLAQVPRLDKPILPRDLSAVDAVSDGWVFVQVGANDPLEEVRWISEMAHNGARIGAIVAALPLLDVSERRRLLQAYRQYPLVHGVRDILSDMDAQTFTSTAFLDGLRDVQQAGLSFDVTVQPTQIRYISGIAKLMPQLTLILDHAGNPNIAADAFQTWAHDLQQLAQHPNIVCKVSGLATRITTERPLRADDYQRIEPYVRHVVACFGAQRTLYGSDYPVVTLSTTHNSWSQFITDVIGAYSIDEQQWILGRTAQNVYRIHQTV